MHHDNSFQSVTVVVLLHKEHVRPEGLDVKQPIPESAVSCPDSGAESRTGLGAAAVPAVAPGEFSQ